jgi:hypothetical protein
MIEALSILVHIHRNMNAANDRAILREASVRIVAVADDGVSVCGGEGLQRSIGGREVLPQPFIVLQCV